MRWMLPALLFYTGVRESAAASWQSRLPYTECASVYLRTSRCCFAQVYVLTLTIFQFNVVQDDLSDNPNWAYVGLVRLPPEGDGTQSTPPHRQRLPQPH